LMSTGTGKPVKQQKSEKFLIAALRSSTKKIAAVFFHTVLGHVSFI